MKKSDLKKLIKEEIKNTLTEAESITIGYNEYGNGQVTVTPGGRGPSDGVDITDKGQYGAPTVYIPKEDFPKLISFLQSLNFSKEEKPKSNPNIKRMIRGRR
jgi:hypothetical protein